MPNSDLKASSTEAPLRRLFDVVLTTEPARRTRLVQAGLVVLAMSLGGAGLLLLALADHAPLGPVLVWMLAAPGGMLLVFVAIRSGWSARLADPAMTLVQLVGTALACAAAYELAGAARGGVFLVLMVVLMGSLLSATPRQMRWGSLCAVLALGIAMLRHAQVHPGAEWVEFVHFVLLATLLATVSVLVTRMAGMRQRNRRQQHELEAALVRIRELATRDELTGLVNRRHMHELMQQEHQRCVRSGRTFCLAVLDIDGFKAINEAHGRALGDTVLRTVANEAMRCVRVSDAFARWGGDRFVLLLCDARSPLAKGGAERVRAGIGGLQVLSPAGRLRLTASVGLAEHHAGETVEETLDRAERALSEAKHQGRDRLLAAA